MNEKLKQILGETRKYLDFHSVLSGFRPVGLVGLIENNKKFNEYAGTNLPSYTKQLRYLQNFINKNNPNYELIPAWRDLHFIAEKTKKEDIENLLRKYPIPIYSKEGEKELGLILSFPECCVDYHVNGNSNKKINQKWEEYNILPFAPCSKECSKDWIKEYLRLAKEFGLDPNKRFINGKR